MPMLEESRLLKLPVWTKSGAHLGRLIGFEFDTETQVITHYRVRPRGLSARILRDPMLIGREQVISITEEKMIVDDNVEKVMDLAKAKALGLVSNS